MKPRKAGSRRFFNSTGNSYNAKEKGKSDKNNTSDGLNVITKGTQKERKYVNTFTIVAFELKDHGWLVFLISLHFFHLHRSFTMGILQSEKEKGKKKKNYPRRRRETGKYWNFSDLPYSIHLLGSGAWRPRPECGFVGREFCLRTTRVRTVLRGSSDKLSAAWEDEDVPASGMLVCACSVMPGSLGPRGL